MCASVIKQYNLVGLLATGQLHSAAASQI